MNIRHHAHGRRTAGRIAAGLALGAMSLAGAGAALAPAATDAPAGQAAPATGEVALAALPELTFATGVYTENRISDHVQVPPGAVIVFQGLPPGLTYDPATTAIKGVPTTPGVYNPVATAYLGGIPVRTASTKVTITGAPVAAPAPAPGAPAEPAPSAPGAPAAAPAPGTIDIAMIQGLALPQPVKDALLGAATAINNGIQAAWGAVPAGSLGK